MAIEGEEGNGKQKYRIFDCVIVLFGGGDRDNPFTFIRIIFLQITKYIKILYISTFYSCFFWNQFLSPHGIFLINPFPIPLISYSGFYEPAGLPSSSFHLADVRAETL